MLFDRKSLQSLSPLMLFSVKFLLFFASFLGARGDRSDNFVGTGRGLAVAVGSCYSFDSLLPMDLIEWRRIRRKENPTIALN